MTSRITALIATALLGGVLLAAACGAGLHPGSTHQVDTPSGVGTGPTAQLLAKTSNASQETGEVSLVVEFSKPLETLPTVTITEVVPAVLSFDLNASAAPTTRALDPIDCNSSSSCFATEGGSVLTVTLPVAGCTELVQYDVTFSGATAMVQQADGSRAEEDVADYTLSFTSADDEAENEESAVCWTTINKEGTVFSDYAEVDIGEGFFEWVIDMDVWGARDDTDMGYMTMWKVFDSPFAMAIRIIPQSTSEGTAYASPIAGLQVNPRLAEEEPNNFYRNLLGNGCSNSINVITTFADDGAMTMYDAQSSDSWGTEDYSYLCIVMDANFDFSYYASSDGLTYTQLGDDNTELLDFADVLVEIYPEYEGNPELEAMRYENRRENVTPLDAGYLWNGERCNANATYPIDGYASFAECSAAEEATAEAYRSSFPIESFMPVARFLAFPGSSGAEVPTIDWVRFRADGECPTIY